MVHCLNAAVLTCDYSNGICNVVSITDVISENESISIAGQPADFVDNTTYSLNFMSPSMLTYVPTSLFSRFIKLQSFGMANTSLNNLVSNAFTNCGLLTSITLTQNDFPVIPSSFASTCVNVTMLNLFQNNIQAVDSDAFVGLRYLNYVMLRENKITCLPPGVFRHTTVLSNIDLSNNLITKLDPATFRGLPNLNSVMLGNNPIASIPAFDFKYTGMTMGLNIMIENNPIMAISPMFLTRLFAHRTGYTSSTYVNFFDTYGNTTTCIPRNNMYTSHISTYSWPMANVTLTECYNNWNEEEENKPVSCASSLPATTVQPATSTLPADENESGEDPHQWIKNRNFFAIISNAMKNFTANVQFF